MGMIGIKLNRLHTDSSERPVAADLFFREDPDEEDEEDDDQKNDADQDDESDEGYSE
jgi:hypothetical protein